jgi:hypothetical protein
MPYDKEKWDEFFGTLENIDYDEPPMIRKEHCTCFACPTQWEGEMTDGTKFYFRYRHGVARLGFGDTIDEAVMDTSGESMVFGDSLDGVMDHTEYSQAFTKLLAEHPRYKKDA